MKIRSITCFYDPGAMYADNTFDDLAKFCQNLRLICENNGFSVQTCQIATPPFPSLIPTCCDDSTILFAQNLEAKALAAGFDYLSLGPALISKPESYALIATLLAETKAAFFSAFIADQTHGINIGAIQATSRIIHNAATLEAEGFANLRFSTLAQVNPYGPFFPGSFHVSGQPAAFSLAIEAADDVLKAFQAADSLAAARTALVAQLETYANQLGEIIADQTTGSEILFQGFDFSVAPFPEDQYSLGKAIETLGVPALGLHGSLAAAAFLADTLDRGNWLRTGLTGLMLPLLEDLILAQRSIDGSLTIKDLLMYSAVCGTGLDTIPLAGDVSEEAIQALLLDIAALATRLRKPLTARLMPVPHKKAGEMTTFNFPYFANGRIFKPGRPAVGRFVCRRK